MSRVDPENIMPGDLVLLEIKLTKYKVDDNAAGTLEQKMNWTTKWELNCVYLLLDGPKVPQMRDIDVSI